MNSVARATEKSRAKLSQSAHKFLPAKCSLIAPTFRDGGSAGDSEDFTTVATKIPVKTEHVSGGIKVTVGGESVVKGHRLTLPFRAETVAITQRYKIKVEAQESMPEMTFEKPISQVDSMSPFLVVAADLVTQGYQQ